MAKRRKTKKCPVCKIEVKADRLDGHLKNAHPEASGKGPAELARGRRPARLVAGSTIWMVVAVTATIVVAGVAIYFASRPAPEEPPSTDGNNGNGTPSGVYPTAWVRISLHGTGKNSNIQGIIDVELYGNETPKTVQNFLELANRNYYSGTIFHRVERDFVIQGGGYDQEMNYNDPAVPNLKLEATPTLKNLKGTIAMARQTDPDTATSQFYFNVVDNPHLDAGYNGQAGYTVFGKITNSAGMDLVTRIDQVPLKAGTSEPEDPIIIDSVTNFGPLSPM